MLCSLDLQDQEPYYTPLHHAMSNTKAVDHQPYLGITISETFNGKTHILDVKNNANKTLGCIKRNLHSCPERVKAQAYTSLVRPILEYGSTAWDPYRIYQKSWLEQVQRRAARFATKAYSRREGCVTQALNHLNRPFYRYGGHIELIRFKEYYRMPGGMSTFRLYFRALFGAFFLKVFLE